MYSKFRKIVCAMTLLAFIVTLLAGSPFAYAATLDDGTYTIDYVIKKPEDESASMANDYWDKPATIIVSDGAIKVRMTVNHSEWVTKFKVPSGSNYVDAKVISSNSEKNTRLVEFSLDSLEKSMLSQIHVTVPEIDYDHDYTIRFVYNIDTLQLISQPEATLTPEPTTTPQPTASASSDSKESDISIVKQTTESTSAPTTKPNSTIEPTAEPTIEPTTEPVNSTTSSNEKDNDESSVLTGNEDGVGEGEQETVELAPALDGATIDNSATVVAAGVSEDTSKQKATIIIAFLSLLLVAGVVVVVNYRKRKARKI